MKKISIKNLDLMGIEKISMLDLKYIIGGEGDNKCMADCNCPTGYEGMTYYVEVSCEGGCTATDYDGAYCTSISEGQTTCLEKMHKFCIPVA